MGNFSGTVVITGPAGSGKTERLLAAYTAALRSGEIGSGLWLAPTYRAASEIRSRLVGPDFPACLSPNCGTFDELTLAVLDQADRPVRSITGLMKRSLLARLIDQGVAAGRLKYFEPIAHTSGLLDQVSEFITELKRLEIWPEEFAAACRERGQSAKDRELSQIYNEYQLLLNKHNLYDLEGRLWAARAALREGQRRPYERLRFVVVDGFTDFTRTQHEVLEILAERAEWMAISLPGEPAPARSDLFAKTARTLKELARRHQKFSCEPIPRLATAAWPAMRHLETQVFRNPRELVPAADASGVEIIAASGELGDIESVGRRIKLLLTHGDGKRQNTAVRPSEVMVVFRSLRDSGSLVREVFEELGIPTAVETQPTLERAPLIGALLSLLKLHVQDWPFRGLLAFLTHNYFRPKWREWADGNAIVAAEHLVRRLQIPSGRAQLLKPLERWASQPQPDPPQNGSDDRRDFRSIRWEQANLAWPLLERLAKALDNLPKKASLDEWAAALAELAHDVGLFNAVGGHATQAAQDRDVKAWEQLESALKGTERLARWLDEPSPDFTAQELLEELAEIVRRSRLPRQHGDEGRVCVVSAATARSLSAPYVFFAGLSEKSFPQPDREDRIYGESDISRLAAAGLPLVVQTERSQEEMLLFYEVLTRATRRLWLSYPALDAKAQPLSPSPYLTEVERACGEGRIRRTSELQLSPVPVSLDLCSPTDLRVKAVATGLDGEAALLAGMCSAAHAKESSDNLLAALRLNQARRGRGFGPFDGLVLGDAARSELAKNFGPERCWSASQLEQYAACPHQFFLQSVLRIRPLEDLALEVDHLTRGRMLHGALATLHRRINQRRGAPSSPLLDAEADYQRETTGILAELMEALLTDSPIEGALREVDRRLLTGWLATYRQQHESYEKGSRDCDLPPLPTHFEVSFGPQRKKSGEEEADLEFGQSDPLSSDKPYSLACGSESVQLSGRIDRIDVGVVAGQTVFNIVDYKSGSDVRLGAKAVADGLALQLPLYAMAVQDLLLAGEGAVPWRAAYWYLKGKGYKEALAFYTRLDQGVQVSDDWDTLRGMLVARVLSLVRGIRDGQFPMLSAHDDCTGTCPYRTVCRVHHARALEKAWTPPLVEIS